MVLVLFIAGDQVPDIPLSELVGNGFNTSPTHIGDTAVNVGVIGLFTVIVNVVVLAHCPEFGVKVYVVVAVLFNAGDQVPVIALVDVVGSGLKLSPLHIGDTAVNDGVTDGGFTVIVSVVVLAHCPEFGVKVYVVVAVLFNAGDQVPDIPLSEVVGNGFNTSPTHIGDTAVKFGVIVGGFTVMVSVVSLAHCPAFGVKV